MSINIQDYITASGQYKNRLTDPELTEDVKINATKLLERVNGLLRELGISTVQVSSGFRPSNVNATIPGAAKASNHTKGSAIDLVDIGQVLSAKITKALLVKYDLYMENPASTKTWVHLQTVRVKSGNRVFNP